MTTHWSTDLLGLPWRAGARGPDAFDCWGLVCWVYSKRLGIQLPSYAEVMARDTLAVARHIEATRIEWLELEKPERDCVVAMGQRFLSHVGLYIPEDGGLVLHAVDKANVTAEPLKKLVQRYRRVEFFRHGDNRSNP